MSYAENTKVPVSQSQNEIKRTLEKYSATGFAFGEQGSIHVVMFEMKNRRVKFILPVPQEGVTKDSKGWRMGKDACEKEIRRRWRCLLIAIKSKLECIESGISSFEDEFLANIVLPNGMTVGQEMLPQINASYRDGKMPPLLGYSS